tara:strand:+ start:844 stop:984 length:141 start_codon:yes stop_codon:yes gene_type:complete
LISPLPNKNTDDEENLTARKTGDLNGDAAHKKNTHTKDIHPRVKSR